MSRRTPLGQVLGLGSAKDGTGHWWAQRVTAVAMIPLGLWLLFALTLQVGGGGSDYLSMIDWIARPLNAVLLILTIATLCYHSTLGVQVVIEDYVHGGLKVVSLLLQKFAHVIAAVSAVFAVLKIALQG